jgi:anti-sigma regulatory factor (Ser/Thr protein kinase)
MVCTIVRIAERPATCKSPKPMNTDGARIECTLDNDGRLILAVGTMVGHAAQRAGLPDEVQQCLAASAVQACRETFAVVNNHGSQLHQDSSIRLSAVDFADRVEVTIEYSGQELPRSSLDSVRRCGVKEAKDGVSSLPQDALPDRVQCESSQGRSRMTLIKYHGPVKSGPNE